MPDRASIAGDRDRLTDIAERLVAGMATVRLNAGQLAAVRWQLCRQLLTHLSSDDKALYRNAMQDRRVAGGSSAFADDAALDAMFTSFLDHWTTDRIRGDSAGFCADTIRIVSAVLGGLADERRRIAPPIARARRLRQG